MTIIFKRVELFIELNEISKSVLRFEWPFLLKIGLLLSNRSPESVYFKHGLFQRTSKILTIIEFLKGGTLASWINWRRLGFVFVCCARHLLYFRGHKSSFILNQLPGFIVLRNKTIFLAKSSMFLFVLWGYILLIFWYIHVTKPLFHWLVCNNCLIPFNSYNIQRQTALPSVHG